MDEETPTTSEKAVREEVALVETVEYGGPEYATATQRRRRRRRHVMRNPRSPRFAFSFCLLAIVSVLFTYWLAKYNFLVKKTTLTKDTTKRIILTSVDTTKPSTTTKDLCQVNHEGYKVDGWCYMHTSSKCKPPFTLSTLFDRGTKAASTLKKYVISKNYSWIDFVFYFAARADCSGGFIEYLNGTKIDKKKYKEYFNLEENFKCGGQGNEIVMQFIEPELFTVGETSNVQNGFDYFYLCEFKL